MEKLDPNRQLQVWQRVAAGPQPQGGDLRPMLLNAAETVAVYRHLLGQMQGKPRQQIKQLLQMAQNTLHCLRGIQSMSGYPAGNLRTPPVPKELPRRLLEKSFHRAGRQIAEYTARTLDPEFGTVWQGLADREREAVMLLAQMIGEMA